MDGEGGDLGGERDVCRGGLDVGIEMYYGICAERGTWTPYIHCEVAVGLEVDVHVLGQG